MLYYIYYKKIVCLIRKILHFNYLLKKLQLQKICSALCLQFHLVAFLSWFQYHQDLLALWVYNCLLIARCQVEDYSDRCT